MEDLRRSDDWREEWVFRESTPGGANKETKSAMPQRSILNEPPVWKEAGSWFVFEASEKAPDLDLDPADIRFFP